MRYAEPIDPAGLAGRGLGALLLWVLLTAGCSHAPEPGPEAVLASMPSTPPSTPPSTTPSTTPSGAQPLAPVSTAHPVPTPASRHSPAEAAASTAPVTLPAPRRVRHWDDYRLQAAQRMVAASPGATYDGPVPEPLLAIPVLTIELNRDGSVRRIQVLRRPTQAHDTVQLAIAAVHRAAPYGPVGHLPKPWTFNEVFLFDETRRFKPRTLDD